MILTSSFNKIAQLQKRIRIIQGSSSASKTYSILQKLVLQAQISKESKLVSIVTDTNVNVSKGAFRDFENITEDLKIELKGTKHPIEYSINNWTFEFFGLDDSRKAKGGRRDILFLNEGNRVKWETARQLIMRTRDVVYIDYNPDCDFWADEKYIGNSDVDFCIVTYLDNEACPQTAIDEIESYKETDPEWYKVFGLGIKGDLFKGKVFAKWEEIEQFPEIDGFWYGLDFGFSNDPTAIVKTVMFREKIYLDEILYQTGLTNGDIARLLKQTGYNGQPVICDSAEPKSIMELRQFGINAIGADKRAGSIMAGIDFLKRHKVLVTMRSENIIRENKHYKWKQDRDGKHLNQPLDWMNHAIDAIRYAYSISGFSAKDEPVKVDYSEL
jgi:phage terminase large subunit